MNTKRSAILGVTLGVMALIGCSDGDPSAPERAEALVGAQVPQLAIGEELLTPLTVTMARTEDAVATRWIGPRGGWVSAGDVVLVVPPGALRQGEQITLRVPAGDEVQAQFEPHGLVFEQPALLMFGLAGANAFEASRALGAYTPVSGGAGIQASELYPIVWQNRAAAFWIGHFSEYRVVLKGYILVGG